MPCTRTMVFLLIVGLWAGTAQANKGEDTTSPELDAEQQQAKEEGMRLYGIRWRSVAIHHLEKAAEAGDVESMYTLGEIYRFMDRGMSHEAIDWYHRAAEGGDPYAMLRLNWGMICELADICPEEHDTWAEMALGQELPKAEEGDPDAMLALYSIYVALEEVEEGRNWLRNAARAGLPQAQDLWASRIQERSGEWPPPLEDVKAAEPWFRKAAEQGYAPGMYNLSLALRDQERYNEDWKWTKKSSRHGHISGRLAVGWCYLDNTWADFCPDDADDTVKGWAILHAVYEETRDSTAEGILGRERDRMTEDEIAEAEELAEEWLNREPPLSYFPPKYGL
ncbi:tetratricopeptide repeat protein [Alkalilimnicola ehrlichii MLHE-1]|uniref:Sel1 domain protein repeat-containing protein n=1 Tax=Alkalilimnicola ehrlichii (strain ATCC BAA-1101 / DSM 17681 / MLHE-1) TaxID=187272 RepID=Q0A9J9_ALKEH|nr:tetratricopeptide repeat protein [Alkalilimnicola ehrlichii]ABI56488.1 conserved hypothetical protein [Alkalilimnicola ehrlichii MLHE-1]